MSEPQPDQQLINHLCRQNALTQAQASKLVQEVLCFYNESCTDFIRRRHYELQKSGLNNATIYRMILEEITQHRFIVDPMSERQVRRAIYG